MKRLVVSALLFVALGVNAHVETHRSEAAKAAFARSNPCPTTELPKASCPGYVIDHIIPLCAGGKDSPSNMQWQTIAQGHRKDKREWQLCRKLKSATK